MKLLWLLVVATTLCGFSAAKPRRHPPPPLTPEEMEFLRRYISFKHSHSQEKSDTKFKTKGNLDDFVKHPVFQKWRERAGLPIDKVTTPSSSVIVPLDGN